MSCSAELSIKKIYNLRDRFGFLLKKIGLNLLFISNAPITDY